MAKRTTKKTTKKKPIESYDHKDKKRTNNPSGRLSARHADPSNGGSDKTGFPDASLFVSEPVRK